MAKRSTFRPIGELGLICLLSLLGCTRSGLTGESDNLDDLDQLDDDDDDDDEDDGSNTGNQSDDDPGDDDDDDVNTPEIKFDLNDQPDLSQNDDEDCDIDHHPCDAGDDDPWHAFGLNCPGEIEVEGTFTGNEAAIGVFDQKLGTTTVDTWPILEGERYVALSTGEAKSIFELFACEPGKDFIPVDEALDFPAPINPKAVTGDCTLDSSQIGTGDCSKTLEKQWEAAGVRKGNDWAELRFTVQVPDNIHGFAFDFAFLSAEYPTWFGSEFNDLFVAWLESESWTGNISFDAKGQPISLNAGFLDFKDGDAPNDPSCPPPCRAPELAGTCVEGHAATKWLTTNVGVTPGETITLVLGVIDLGDDILDAIVLLDNFRWSCKGGKPETNPK